MGDEFTIKHYEMQGGRIKSPSELMDMWLPGGFTAEIWIPRVKWFHPPRIRLFRWAYKIEHRLYTNIAPTGISGNNTACNNVDIDIHVSGYSPNQNQDKED